MTDTERERINAICEVAGVAEIDDLSDGFHTFRQLYYQRMILFAVIVKQNKDRAWKSLRHEDGELCFGGGWFIVGIDTPEGSYTYHYENKYFSLFDCEILVNAKHWDGHTEKDVTRLLSLQDVPDINVGRKDLIDRRQTINEVKKRYYKYGRFAKIEELIWCIEKLPSAQPELITQDAYVRGFEQGRTQGNVDAKLQPERKKGHWISQDHNKSNGMITTTVYYFPKCSVCGCTSNNTNYCPNCGAYMKGSD